MGFPVGMNFVFEAAARPSPAPNDSALTRIRLPGRPRPALLLAALLARLRIISLLLAAFLLAGCSAIRLGYNQAPELAYWYLDDYVDFTGAQSLQVKADLSRLLAWHRQTQLPGYIEVLQGMQRQARGDVTAAQACQQFADVRRRLMLVAQQAEPAMAQLASSLDASQLQAMERKFAKSNADYRKDYIDGTPQQLRKRRTEEAVKRSEMLYGGLDERQTQLVERLLAQSVFDAQRSYNERQRRQRDILQTLRQSMANRPAGTSQPAESMRPAVRELVERVQTSPDAGYRDYAARLTQDGCRLFAELHNNTTPAQRAKAQEVLEGYQADFKVLVAQGNS